MNEALQELDLVRVALLGPPHRLRRAELGDVTKRLETIVVELRRL